MRVTTWAHDRWARSSFESRLWTLIAAGTALSTALAFAFFGSGFDIDNAARAGAELSGPDPLHIYSELNQGVFYRYPYPPGYFAWIAASTSVANHSPLPFHGVLQIPMVLANVGIALLVQAYLGARGAGERTRLVAAGAVVLGPVFVGISGYHGQIDAVAFLPAVAAVIVWEDRAAAVLDVLRPEGEWGGGLAARLDANAVERALAAGLLIGAGGAIKTVPLILLAALLPTAAGLRQALVLLAAAAVIPFVLLLPFLLADPDGVLTLGEYSGAPGLGGLGLAVQPDLLVDWLVLRPLEFHAVTEFLFEHGERIVQVVLVAVFVFVRRFRPEPVQAVVLACVAVYVFSPNFFFQYLIWGLPFFLMAGYVREAIALQAAVLIPMLIGFLIPWPTGHPAAVYAPLMLLVWVGFIVALVRLVRRFAAWDEPANGAPSGPLEAGELGHA